MINKTVLTPLKSRGLLLNFSSARSGPPNWTSKFLNALSDGANSVYGPVSLRIVSNPDCRRYLAIACNPLFFRMLINSDDEDVVVSVGG